MMRFCLVCACVCVCVGALIAGVADGEMHLLTSSYAHKVSWRFWLPITEPVRIRLGPIQMNATQFDNDAQYKQRQSIFVVKFAYVDWIIPFIWCMHNERCICSADCVAIYRRSTNFQSYTCNFSSRHTRLVEDTRSQVESPDDWRPWSLLRTRWAPRTWSRTRITASGILWVYLTISWARKSERIRFIS